MKDNYVTLCASFHDILEQGYRIFPFEIYRATKCPMGKRDGIFTPYNEIEGKTFKILDIELSDAEVEENTIFALQSEEGDTLYWYAKRVGFGDRTLSAERTRRHGNGILSTERSGKYECHSKHCAIRSERSVRKLSR